MRTCIVLAALSERAWVDDGDFPGHPGIWSWDRLPKEILYPVRVKNGKR